MAAAAPGVTFKVSDVRISTSTVKKLRTNRMEKNKTLFPIGKGAELIYTSESAENSEAAFGHGLVGAFWEGYSDHKIVVLRPDDVHLSIMIAFSGFMASVSEVFRKNFVDHEGKIDLHIIIQHGALKDAWEEIMNQFASIIKKSIQGEMLEWVTPNYSTTKRLDIAVGQACLMGMMKNYFSYNCSMMCGIPSITLQGTLEDWEKVRSKAEMIKELAIKAQSTSLDAWYSILVPILDNFILAYRGTVDKKWWNSAVNYQSGGSSSPWVTGWALAFVPFDKQGQWQLNSVLDILKTGHYGKLRSPDFTGIGRIMIPVKFQNIDGYGDFDGAIYAGSQALQWSSTTVTPVFDLAIAKNGPHSNEKDQSEISPYSMFGAEWD